MGSGKNSRGTMYSEEFQAMLDRLEEEDECEGAEEEEEEEGGADGGGGGRRRRKMRGEQVRALEAKFEEEWRLSPARKAAIAAELGLEAKQVAVWFQNRRSRCKSKQIEREFVRLRSVYDHLRHDYELLQQETNSLHLQLKDLEAKAQARGEAMKGESSTIPNPQANPCGGEPSDNVLSTASMSPATIEGLIDPSMPFSLMDDTFVEWQPLGGLAGGEGGSSSDTWDLYDLIR